MINKIYIIVHHLADYYFGLSLLKTTDEGTESMHQFVNKRLMSSYQVKNVFNPNHGIKLYNCICHINSYNEYYQ